MGSGVGFLVPPGPRLHCDINSTWGHSLDSCAIKNGWSIYRRPKTLILSSSLHAPFCLDALTQGGLTATNLVPRTNFFHGRPNSSQLAQLPGFDPVILQLDCDYS